MNKIKKTCFTICLLAFVVLRGNALSVTITQTGTAANVCLRTLKANVSGGSGNYSYSWSITTPGVAFPGVNTLQTINIGLTQTVDLIVTVTDTNTSANAFATTTATRILTGSFSTFIPNVITPNGDGINDNWVIMDAPKVHGIINAYSFTMTIRNSSNAIVYANSGTVGTGYLGYLGGDIFWNAKVNGTGSIVPSGSYPYSLTLVNCSHNQTYTGILYVY